MKNRNKWLSKGLILSFGLSVLASGASVKAIEPPSDGELKSLDEEYFEFYEDFSAPWYVQGMTSQAGKNEVTLRWEPAFDRDSEISKYSIYYGTKAFAEMSEDENYDQKESTDGSETEMTITGLENGVTYYFVATAIDEEGEESYSYSAEVSATPDGDIQAEGSPEINNAIHTGRQEVTVEMTEEVTFTDMESGFIFTNESTGEELEVIDVSTQGSNLIFSFPSGSLMAFESYTVVATSDVEDLDGNPVSSGVTDTYSFFAKDTSEFDRDDITVPEIDPIVTQEEIEDLGIEDGIKIQPIEPLEPITPMEEVQKPAPEKPHIEEIKNLFADTGTAASGSVLVTWTPSIDDQISHQNLYVKDSVGVWGDALEIPKGEGRYHLAVKANTNYRIKITNVLNTNDESKGVETVFTSALTQSGPGSVIALTLALLLVGAVSVSGFGRRVLSTIKR